VTAAAVGAISGAVIVLGQRMILENGAPDLFKVALMLATLGIYPTGRKIPEPLIVLVAAVIGLIAYPMLH
jgi:chromate transporter